MPSKFPLPTFLQGLVDQQRYDRWLKGRAQAHWVRDRKRGHDSPSVSLYKELIHEAVCAQGGRDFYTGEVLDWHLLCTYDNEHAKAGKHGCKRGFDRLPSVDHETADATSATFRICGWATNDAKHALSTNEFVALARKVLEHAGWTVVPAES
jgi:hypothetical protein